VYRYRHMSAKFKQNSHHSAKKVTKSHGLGKCIYASALLARWQDAAVRWPGRSRGPDPQLRSEAHMKSMQIRGENLTMTPRLVLLTPRVTQKTLFQCVQFATFLQLLGLRPQTTTRGSAPGSCGGFPSPDPSKIGPQPPKSLRHHYTEY